MDIFGIYTERAIEKCQRWNFQTPWKPKNSNNKSVYSFARHPVEQKSSLTVFKICCISLIK